MTEAFSAIFHVPWNVGQKHITAEWVHRTHLCVLCKFKASLGLYMLELPSCWAFEVGDNKKRRKNGSCDFCINFY